MHSKWTSSELQIHQHHEAPLDIYNVPWQHLGPMLEEKAVQARVHEATQQRTLLKGMGEVDRVVLAEALKKVPQDDQTWIRHILNLGRYTADKIAEFSEDVKGGCTVEAKMEASNTYFGNAPNFMKQDLETMLI